MITSIQLSTLVFIAAITWGILLILQGASVSIDLVKPFSNVTGVLVLILAFFDKWAWHWRIFYPWLVSTPYIDGTWKGKINSTWVNPKTNQQIKSIEAYLVIRQKFSKVYATLITKEANSELLAGEIIKNPDETWQFVSTYRNTPKMTIRDRSPIHQGSMILWIKGQPPTGLDGQYWTDRNTQGDIAFFGFNKKKFEDFSSASTAKYKTR